MNHPPRPGSPRTHARRGPARGVAGTSALCGYVVYAHVRDHRLVADGERPNCTSCSGLIETRELRRVRR